MKKRRFNVFIVAVGVAVIVVPWKWLKDERDRQTLRLLGGSIGAAKSGTDIDVVRGIVSRFAGLASPGSPKRWIVMEWYATGTNARCWGRYDIKAQVLSVSGETRFDYRNMTDACLTEWAAQPDFSLSYTKGACAQVQRVG